jgi:hypothetical protein
MKKIVLLLMVVILGTAVFAAVPKAATAPAAASSGNLAIGTALGFPTLKYSFNKDFSGQIGAMYASGGGTSSTAFLIKVDYSLEKMGEVQPAVGAFYSTNGATTATNGMGITWGISKMVASNLTLGADFVLFESLTTGGTSTTGVLGPAIVGLGIPGFIHGVTLSVSYSL